MFSATWPREVQAIARQFCSVEPVQIKIGNQDNNSTGLTLNPDIKQTIKILESGEDKYIHFGALISSLVKDSPKKIIVFLKTKRGVDRLE